MILFVLFLLWFNVPVNNFSVMLRRSHLFLGITSTFLGSKCLLLKETNTPTRPRIEPGSPDPESDALTIRPVRPPCIMRKHAFCIIIYAKTKVQISCAVRVTMQLIRTFVFTTWIV